VTDEELAAIEAAAELLVRVTQAGFAAVKMERAFATLRDRTPSLVAEVRRLREEVAASRWSAWLLAWQAIGHTAAGVFAVDIALNTPSGRDVCAHCQAEHDVESGAMAAHVRACPSNPMVQEAAALKAEVARLREDAHARAERLMFVAKERDAAQAEVVRLAGVAREACDVATALDNVAGYDGRNAKIKALRSAIPTPDPAAFVAAVDAYGKAERDCNVGRGGKATEIRDDARAALLALGGVR